MIQRLFTLLLIGSLFGRVFAQTQPQSFDLSQGNFTFNAWDSTAAAQSYPANMYFHRVDNQNPTDADTAKGDWDCVYNLGAGCAIRGKMSEGVSFRNVGAAQTDNCLAGGTTNNGRYVGIAVVGLNTLSRQNIQVSWIGRMFSAFVFSDPPPGSPIPPVNRFYGIKCQYRIGQSGSFVDLPADSLFKCNTNDSTYHPQGFSDTLGPVQLPAICENQPIVQVRWIYYQMNTGSGPRPELGLDDVFISSDISTSISAASSSAFVTKMLKQNPVSDKILRLQEAGLYSVLNMLGQQEVIFSGSERNLEQLPAGVYLLQNDKGQTEKFILP